MAPPASETSLPDRFAGTGPDPVPDGGILTVKYDDPDRAKQTVAISISDGDDSSDAHQLEVELRGNGKGSALFIVPVGWGSVRLAHDGSRPHIVRIALPP